MIISQINKSEISAIASKISSAITKIKGDYSEESMLNHDQARSGILECLSNNNDASLLLAVEKSMENWPEYGIALKLLIHDLAASRDWDPDKHGFSDSRLFCIPIHGKVNTTDSPRGMIDSNILKTIVTGFNIHDIFTADEIIYLHPKLLSLSDLVKSPSYVFHAHESLINYAYGNREACDLFTTDASFVPDQDDSSVSFLVGIVLGDTLEFPSEKIDLLKDIVNDNEEVMALKKVRNLPFLSDDDLESYYDEINYISDNEDDFVESVAEVLSPYFSDEGTSVLPPSSFYDAINASKKFNP